MVRKCIPSEGSVYLTQNNNNGVFSKHTKSYLYTDKMLIYFDMIEVKLVSLILGFAISKDSQHDVVTKVIDCSASRRFPGWK